MGARLGDEFVIIVSVLLAVFVVAEQYVSLRLLPVLWWLWLLRRGCPSAFSRLGGLGLFQEGLFEVVAGVARKVLDLLSLS